MGVRRKIQTDQITGTGFKDKPLKAIYFEHLISLNHRCPHLSISFRAKTLLKLSKRYISTHRSVLCKCLFSWFFNWRRWDFKIKDESLYGNLGSPLLPSLVVYWVFLGENEWKGLEMVLDVMNVNLNWLERTVYTMRPLKNKATSTYPISPSDFFKYLLKCTGSVALSNQRQSGGLMWFWSIQA